MTRSILRPAALAAAVLVATVAPALAVSIRHTNRAEGDPDAAAAPRTPRPRGPARQRERPPLLRQAARERQPGLTPNPGLAEPEGPGRHAPDTIAS